MKLKNRGEPLEKIKINKKGITLIEIILTLALLSIAIGVAYSIHFSGNKSFKVSKDIGFAQQDARIISEYLNKELKYSSKIFENEGNREGRYFSIELRNNSNGTKTLVKTEYKDGEAPCETKLLSKDWENVEEVELEQENRIIKGLITIKLNDNTDYKLPITIPLENINDTSELKSISLSTNKIYYALPKDSLASNAEGEET